MSDQPPQNPIAKALQEAMAQHSFPTIESAQAFAEDFFLEHNRRKVDDFHGLSANQMSQILYAPFDSPELAAFQAEVPLVTCNSTPLGWLLLSLIEGIGEKGVRSTAKGNLPRALCRQLIRENDGIHLYPALLDTYVRKFNWAYWDGYPEVPMVQQSFLFTLYLLTRYGDQERPIEFYADAFLNAFPMLADEIPAERPYVEAPKKVLKRLYIFRCLRRFSVFTGLASLTFESNPDKTDYLNRYFVRVRKTPLLNACWRFGKV